MSSRLSLPNRFRPTFLVPAALLALVFLPGCEDTYSESMVYARRADPVVLDRLAIPIEGIIDPDRPGQLPLFRMNDLNDPRNPFHPPERRKIITGQLADPTALTGTGRDALEGLLKEKFGTPAHPKVDPTPDGGTAKSRANLAKAVSDLRLDDDTLKVGSRLYRMHCLHCHGLSGDGRGPTAKWVNPHPRDYRPGFFKFQSTDQSQGGPARKPQRDDLARTIRLGVEGTSMPAFNLLPEPEIEALVSYVIHLSIRGEAEMDGLKALHGEQDARALLVGKRPRLSEIVTEWRSAQGDVIKPPPYQTTTEKERTASVLSGRALYLANCAACHEDYGRKAPYKADNAGWAILVKPATLTTGVFRGGRRPIDLYWRIHSGINGSGMALHARPAGVLEPEQIWDVVNYLQVLPYPAMREKYGVGLN